MAVIMSIASKLKELPQPKRNILFLATAGHFYGSIGTISFIKRNPELLKTVVSEIHIEHIALEAKENGNGLKLTGRPEPAAIFTNYNKTSVKLLKSVLENHKIDRTLILGAHGPLGNYPPTDGGDFYLEGIPIFNFISNPVYLLVDDDTLDKVDWDRLLPVRNAFVELIKKLDLVSKTQLQKKNFLHKRLLANVLTYISRKKN
jgi:hypothetical protein